MSVTNRLKEIRMREYADDPKEFSDRIGVKLKTYYTWETGNSIPALKECLRVCNILNKDVKEIWNLED